LLDLLVRYGANLAGPDPKGSTCLDILRKDGFSEVAKRIETLGRKGVGHREKKAEETVPATNGTVGRRVRG
jgi:ankyrin repeat protein